MTQSYMDSQLRSLWSALATNYANIQIKKQTNVIMPWNLYFILKFKV